MEANPVPRQRKDYPELDSIRHRLGFEPDHKIAEELGTSTSIVGRYRRKHGVPAYDGYKFGVRPAQSSPPPERDGEPGGAGRGKRGPDRAPRRSKLNPWRALIGVRADDEVAAQAGVTREAVRLYRRRHQIPDPPVARPTASSGRRAFLVVGGAAGELVLVAADMIGAATQALAHFSALSPPALVTRITELGPAIG